MKTALLIAAAVATVVISAMPADAKSKARRYNQEIESYLSYASPYERRARSYYRDFESHDTVRAQAADPTHQYDLPDWARAAISGRGRR